MKTSTGTCVDGFGMGNGVDRYLQACLPGACFVRCLQRRFALFQLRVDFTPVELSLVKESSEDVRRVINIAQLHNLRIQFRLTCGRVFQNGAAWNEF